MKTKKLISTMFASLLTMVLFLTVVNSNAQTKQKSSMMNDCCMMKGGKMMVMKDGKMMAMDKEMTMKNGTTCMTNGECTLKDGKKMMMKEGDCMEMSGKMCNDKMKAMSKNKNSKKAGAMIYSCPMHPEVKSDKAGKCSKCGMDLKKK